jgi:hypothetical protein
MPTENNTPVEGDVLAYNGELWVPTVSSAAGVTSFANLLDVQFNAEETPNGAPIVWNSNLQKFKPTGTATVGARTVITTGYWNSEYPAVKGTPVYMRYNADEVYYDAETEQYIPSVSIDSFSPGDLIVYPAFNWGQLQKSFPIFGALAEDVDGVIFNEETESFIFSTASVVIYGTLSGLNTLNIAEQTLAGDDVVYSANKELFIKEDNGVLPKFTSVAGYANAPFYQTFSFGQLIRIDETLGEIFINPHYTIPLELNALIDRAGTLMELTDYENYSKLYALMSNSEALLALISE